MLRSTGNIPKHAMGNSLRCSAVLLGHTNLYPTVQLRILQHNSRHQSTTADTPSDQASSSSNISQEPSDKKGQASWSLRKRLRRLSLQLGQENGNRESDTSQPSSKWIHPSRAKVDQETLRRKAEERWSEKGAEAAKDVAISSERERLRKNSETTRAEKNVSRRMSRLRRKERKKVAVEEKNQEEKNKEIKIPKKDNDSASKSNPSRFGSQDVQRNWDAVLNALVEDRTESSVRDLPPHMMHNQNDKDGSTEPSSRKKGRNSNERWHEDGNRKSSGTHTELFSGPSMQNFRRVKPADSIATLTQATRQQYISIDEVSKFSEEKRVWWEKEGKWSWTVGGRLSPEDVKVVKVDPLREMQVPQLAHGLDRVLFNPGVHWLRDVRSGIYNFEPKIRNIYDVDLFDYSALPPYRTSSKDPELAELVRNLSKKYSGSTSSMTALLSHIYFLISAWKQPDLTGFSSGFSTMPRSYSYGAKLPASIVLQRFEEEFEGKTVVRYAIDADKGGDDGAVDNSNYVLMQLGKSVEKLLTCSTEEYEKYLRVNSHLLDEKEKDKPEAYHYAMTDKFVMRSQLDCSDDRLPRKSFDLKTRSVIAVRQDRANWVESSGYKIRHATGVFESFEREMWDMTRATMLKYFFQARIGDMDGILVAYHSTASMFGFQYLPCEDMAMRLFSSVEMGEQAFRLSIGMLERILDTITDLKPNNSLRITLDTEPGENPRLFAFAQAVEGGDEANEQAEKAEQFEDLKEDNVRKEEEGGKGEEEDQPSMKEQNNLERRLLQFDVQVDRYLSDELVVGPVDFTIPSAYRINDAMEDEITRRKRADLPPLNWSIEYSITPRSDLSFTATRENLRKITARRENVSPLILPNLEALNEREKMREKELSKNEAALQKFYEDRKNGVAIGMPIVPGQMGSGGGNESAKLLKVGTNEADIEAASADLQEVEEQQQLQQEAPTQRWKRKSVGVERLRELSRMGQRDKDAEELTDRLQVYERRGE